MRIAIFLLLATFLLSCEESKTKESLKDRDISNDTIIPLINYSEEDTIISILNDTEEDTLSFELPFEIVLNDSVKLRLDSIESTVFEKSKYNKEEYNLFNEYCKEEIEDYSYLSYYGNFHECGWEIEKYKLNVLENRNVAHTKEGLIISLDEKVDKIYNGVVPSMPDRSTIYKFFCYFDKTNHYLIEVYAYESCAWFILMNGNNGDELNFDGKPYFSTNLNSIFIEQSDASYCDRKLEYWRLKNGEYKIKGEYELENWYFEGDLKWLDEKSLIGKVKFDYPFYKKYKDQYVKIEIVESTE